MTAPELVHFENAAYPEAAKQAGLQGEVVVKLTIDRAGSVTKAEVVVPAGNGFDEAATAASLRFKFKPALRDGAPVPAIIQYRYMFKLEPAAEPPPPLTWGEVNGTLQIAGADATLAGAEVVLRSSDGSERRASSDAQGKFSFGELPAGKYRLEVRAAGFDPYVSDEDVVAGEAIDVTYRLASVAEGIEITVRGERPPREVTRRTIERREIDRIPGTSGDALRSIQSLPGVARPPGLAGLLIVRGSAPEGTGVFVDGTDVPLIYHFGGLSSVVPTELLDQIDFYPGNFSARYGRVMGGIVDVGLRKPDTRCTSDYMKPNDETGCFRGMAQVDLIDARFLLQGPLPAKNWSFAVAGRRSWVDSWLRPVLEEAGSSVTSAPVYYDYQLIAEHNSPESRTSLRAYGADDRLELIITDPFAEDPGFGGNLQFGTRFYRLQALNEWKLSKDVELRSMLSFGKDAIRFSLGVFEFRVDVYPVYVREEFAFRLAKGVRLNAGIDFGLGPFEVLVRAPEPPRAGEPDSGPFSTRPIQQTKDKDTAFRPAWYAEAELQPTERLRLVPGIRVDYARDSGHADFSPRINGRYDLIKSEGANPASGASFVRRTTLKGGAGVFHQPPEFQETDPVFGTPNLESNRSYHYAFGLEQELTRQIDVSLEGFYKDLMNQVSRAPSQAIGYTYNNLGSGYVVGFETLLKYKPDARFFGWLAYTLSRSIRKNSPDDEEYLFQYDQTHNLIVLGSYRLGRGWEFGARFRIVSGPLDTPTVAAPALPAIYASDAGAYAPLEGEAFSERLPLFHQLDLRIDKRWQFRSWRLAAYLDVQNAYNNAAAEALVYNYNYSRRSYQTGVPIIPSIGLRGEF